ncbi:MAG: hypothetical protein OQK19_03480 [Sedimenticola sp.]|uniref:DUF948 domain-containing protein n=1 Tax=Sedimenticola thiotaurini TaxID=1543721 RepID=A0A558D6L0_9GAMM|nr:hypothetical protein [Sedimenticola sp.]TVT56643.1 MAG: hypothetical protein FHK82_07020 [Sedimenticola thiotaurini]MCW8881161.1 hypothetical protein [Sedimenticola sp.]MCW8920834.1 hypothetical protein [Sedimenticola sp.]MCW8947162.1 hypothetical protein [Sedimenticola sp.]
MTQNNDNIDQRQEPLKEPIYSIDRLSEAFETSARRWELIVYPSLFAFIILAAYGFFLVYSLAKDVHYLAVSVDSNMTVLAGNMQSVSDNMGNMTSNIKVMSDHMAEINQKVGTLEPMLVTIGSMDRSMESMTQSTYIMRNDISRMNQNISRPMSFMNTFLPW